MVHEMPAPHVGSSRLPRWKDLQSTLLRCALCLACLLALLWLVLLVLVILLLSYSNTPAVRAACAGFWDFMLISILSPVLIPLAYCVLSCGAWPWAPFSGACMLIMGASCLHLTLMSSENSVCVEAIRSTSPPLPWLIYIGWLKSALYLAGALSSLSSHLYGHHFCHYYTKANHDEWDSWI
jgi:hypothetical protein